jgi:hypothetical protein
VSTPPEKKDEAEKNDEAPSTSGKLMNFTISVHYYHLKRF